MATWATPAWYGRRPRALQIPARADREAALGPWWLEQRLGAVRSRDELRYARAARLRTVVAVQSHRLRAALEALDRLDERLAEFVDDGEIGWHDGNGRGNGAGTRDHQPALGSPSDTDLPDAELRQVFEALLDEDDERDWTVLPSGVRIPRLSAVNSRLRELDLDTLTYHELTRVYINYLDGA